MNRYCLLFLCLFGFALLSADEPPSPYSKSLLPRLDPGLFLNPSSEYRGTPFWSWNTAMSDTHLAQIDELGSMGFGGVTIHARTGLATEYLGDDFMRLVRASVERAQARGMYVLLYDEDRWPSGFAGGLVTRDEAFRQRVLRWTCKPGPQEGVLLARFAVELDKEGGLLRYVRLATDAEAPDGLRVWRAYRQISRPSAWHNNQTYVDVLNPEAIRRFAKLTHDRYYGSVGAYYGKGIPGIFTDEPMFAAKTYLASALGDNDCVLPFTDSFSGSYRAAYSQNFEDFLPELFWDSPEGTHALVRYRYHDHVAELFSKGYFKTLSEHCARQGIAFTGHLMGEQPLTLSNRFTGDAMRCLQYMQIPGIDMLTDNVEMLTAKQAQSAAHQAGRNAVLSELYGVTGWHFDFGGHKRQGDWQAALGVTLRVPHLAWASMAGEAKRDYPAAIGWQSPWYREYPLVENHFARLNTALTRGTPLVRVAVVHPNESIWLCEGPRKETELQRARVEKDAKDFADWLLLGQIDFDYVCEASLPSQFRADPKGFQVGSMTYEVVVVPQVLTLRSSTLERLEQFVAQGGRVVFVGKPPLLVDAQPSERAVNLASRCSAVPATAEGVRTALGPWRDLTVSGPGGVSADRAMYQMRQDGDRRWLFICQNGRVNDLGRARISVRGDWSPTLYDTLTGEITRLAARREGDCTVFDRDLYAQGSLLVSLEPGLKPGGVLPEDRRWAVFSSLDQAVPVTLSEPNVLLLDQPEWRWNDETWQPREEVLRIDDALRARLKLPERTGKMAQPYTDLSPVQELGTVTFRHALSSEIEVSAPCIALEDSASAEVRVDGKPVLLEKIGIFVDACYSTFRLPTLSVGVHQLEISYRFTRKTNLEWAYLLGDFGVRKAEGTWVLCPPVRSLTPGSWVEQGLPFYAGNVTYHHEVQAAETPLRLRASSFQSPLLSVNLDGRVVGKIAFAPYELDLGSPAAGRHSLDITAYGNRSNAFGVVHNVNMNPTYYGPGAYRTKGKEWTYDYTLRPTGLLQPAQLLSPAGN